LLSPESDESRSGAALEGALYAAPQILGGLKKVAGLPGVQKVTSPITGPVASGAGKVMGAANKFFTGRADATVPSIARAMDLADEARMAESAQAAGRQAEQRYLGRQMDAAGFNPTVTQKVSGLHPNAPRSMSSASGISANDVDVSGLMDEAWPGRYTKGPVQGLMRALENNAPAKGPTPEELDRIIANLDSRVSGVGPQGPTLPPNHSFQTVGAPQPTPQFTSPPQKVRGSGVAMDALKARAFERFGKRYYSE
jgi:hypothetical protein